MHNLFVAALIAAVGLAGCARTPSMADPNTSVAPVATSTDATAEARAASTANGATSPTGDARAAPPSGIPGLTKPAPPMSKPLPPQVLPARPDLPHLDTSCRSDNDCVVKNVGSCCGAKPACLNRDSKVDPGAVQADCAAHGLSSTCGFEDIRSCTCDAGTCRAASSPVSQ